jgi:pyruvate/2-oxoglutarate dehydrogenase complex dihydrolipoamide dehydrogenase (E3) component
VESFDLVIIGGGAAGSEAAFSQGGSHHRIVVVESHHFGGTCTNHGCVPTKALAKAARVAHGVREAGRYGVQTSAPTIDWGRVIGRAYEVRDEMLRFGTGPFEEAGIEVRYPAEAVITGERRVEIDGDPVEARNVLLTTGLEAAIPPVPGLRESGYLDNESVLELTELPRRMAVIGSGPIGSEFAQIFARFGVKVTVIEMADRLIPVEEPESSAAVRQAFEAENIECLTSAKIDRVERRGDVRVVHLAGRGPLEVDQILVAAGRSLDGRALGLDAAGIAWTPKGVTVDATLRTSQPWAWAAGDVIGGPLFTHVAAEEGQVAGRNALRGDGELERIDLSIVPRVTFTDPEVASVGLGEQQAREAGRDIRIGFAKVEDAEKAQIDGSTIGHVKVVADATTGHLLGCAIVSETAGDMIHEAVAMLAGQVPVGAVARTMHAYPTLSELMRTACSQAAG